MEKRTFPNFDLLSQEIKEHLDKYDEGTLFRTIESLGAVRFNMQHAWSHNRTDATFEEVDQSEELSATVQVYCLERLQTLGIVPNTIDKNYRPLPDYWKWYRWYDRYFRDLERKEQDRWMDAIDANQPTDEWQPEGTWKE